MPAKTSVTAPGKKTRRKYRCLTRERAAYTVTVCESCRRASCWQGHRYCDESRGAGTVQETRTALALLNLESSHYWTPKAENG